MSNKAWSEAFLKAFKPKQRLTISQWADLYRHVGTGREKGQWRTDRTPYLREIMDSACDPTVERIVMMCSAQVGKALCVDTPIFTADNLFSPWKTMGTLKVGDVIFDENFKPCTVTFATPFMYDRECFDVVFDDGSVIRADAEHRWAVNGERLGEWDVVTTKELQVGFWVPPVIAPSMVIEPARRVKRVKPCESVPVRCIQVDSPSHLFLAGHGMVPTHNTETQLNIVGYYISSEPTEILFVFPTDGVAEQFSKERLNPMIEGTDALRDRITEEAPVKQTRGRRKRRQQSTETTTMKQFHGGFLAMVGAQSSANLASRAVKIAQVDELDRTSGDNKEGSILDQIDKRTNTYIGDRKIIITSTPHLAEDSPTYEEFLKGDQRHYYVPCVHCGVANHWTMDQVRWEKDEKNNVIEESIRHLCPDCGGVIRGPGTVREELLKEGFWEPHAPQNTRYARSYYLWAIYSPWVPLKNIVNEYVTAMRSRDPTKIKTMTNLTLGLPYKEKEEDSDLPAKLFKRRERYKAEVPREVGLLTCGVDVQGAYLVAEVVGWGAGKESYGIDYRMFPGDPAKPEVWEDLRRYLLTQRRHESGAMMDISCTFVDSGGHHTQEVYRFTQSLNADRVYACKGGSTDGIPLVGKPSFVGPTKTPLYILGVNEGKFRIMEWLKEKRVGAGYCHWPDEHSRGYDEEYFEGLCSEKFQEVLERGKLRRAWTQTRRRNEPLDVRNYAMAAMELLNPDLEEWVAYYSAAAPTVEIEEETRTAGQLSKGIRL